MSVSTPVLHMMCGKIASGKSTFAQTLSFNPSTFLISEDDWLARLYPDEVHSLEDYVRCSRRIRSIAGEYAVVLLEAGVSVVLDFPANTKDSRQWMRGIFENAGVSHELHYFDITDEVCKARLKARNAEGVHAFTPSEADFDLFSSYFEAPGEDEGFCVVVHEG